MVTICGDMFSNVTTVDRVVDIIHEDTTSLNKIDILNNLASKLKEIGNGIQYFERLMEYVNPKTTDEVLQLADSMYEFELFDGIKDAEDYGRYMICESGHFEYDDNLEEYIDFKRYGQVFKRAKSYYSISKIDDYVYNTE